MNEKIGVIVPVYKTEKYIAECIESILAQTYTNFRLILVDDGTPDGAGAICDEYATKDQRITVIHQENAGVTRARARGVEEAADCEWITFVDSDDMLATTALYQYLGHTSKDVDIVLNSTYYTETNPRASISPFYTIYSDYWEIEDFRRKMISTQGAMPWGRIFRNSIITPFVFDIPRSVFYGEDGIINARIAFNTNKKVAVIHTPLYFYRQDNNGVCKNFDYSHEYENLLNKHIYKSIPRDVLNQYGNELIWRRLWIWTSLFNRSVKRPNWSNTSFHKNLVNDIIKFNYNIGCFNWRLLKYNNPIIRCIIITIRKGYSLFKRII